MKFRKPFVNNRVIMSHTPSPEPVVAEARGGAVVAILAEAPADPGNVNTPMVVVLGGSTLARVTGAPQAGQYRVLTTSVTVNGVILTEFLPLLEFHSSAEGQQGTCDYWRTGSIFTSEWQDNEMEFARPIRGYADVNSLAADYPPGSDTNTRGFPGDMAIISDGSLAISNGTLWALSGTPGGKYEAPMAVGLFTATVTEIQQMAEQLQASAQALISLDDKYQQVERVQADAAGAGSVEDVFNPAGEVLTATGQAAATVDDVQRYVEGLQAAGLAIVTVDDLRLIIEAVQGTGQFAASVADLAQRIEDFIATGAFTATVTDQQTGGGITGFTENFTGTNGDAPSATHWDTPVVTNGAAGSYMNIQSNSLAAHLKTSGGTCTGVCQGKESITFSNGKSFAVNMTHPPGSPDWSYAENGIFMRIQAAGSTGNVNCVDFGLRYYGSDDGESYYSNADWIVRSFDGAGNMTDIRTGHGDWVPPYALEYARMVLTDATHINFYGTNGAHTGEMDCGNLDHTATLGSLVKISLHSYTTYNGAFMDFDHDTVVIG